jgi:hypothetical protein
VEAPSPWPDAAGLPDGAWLLERERHSRQEGSGIEPAQLVGTWLLVQTWPRRALQPAALSSALLRGLQASLTLAAPAGATGDPTAPLTIVNRVQLGVLELRFEGVAWLQGRRPLLLFRFEQLRLRLGPWLRFDRPLAGPGEGAVAGGGRKGLPFFALIATGSAPAAWLAARGRGGGLALWCRSPEAAIARV